MEFALVLPLFLLLVLAMADFGRAFNRWNDQTHLASEAARYAAVDKSPSGGQKIEDWIQGQALSPTAQVLICFPNGTHNGGDPVHVTITDTYNWIQFHPKIMNIDTNWVSTSLKANSEMRLETSTVDNSNHTGTWNAATKTCT